MGKIIFDLSFVVNTNINSGVAKYGYRVLDYIIKSGRQDNYILLLNKTTALDVIKNYPQFEYIVIGKRWMKYARFLRFFFYMISFKKNVKNIKSDVIFCPYGNIINCLTTKQKKVAVIHDLQVQVDRKIRKKRYFWLHKFAEDKIMDNSLFVFTISDFSRNQILSFYPKAANKVLNMSNSVSMVNSENIHAMQPGYRYLLYCGRLFVQKNVMTLVKSFCLLISEYPDLKLVLIAKDNNYWQNTIKPYAEENGILEHIVLTGSCTEEELSQWYMGASCFVFPSLREGFGSPPIEAAYMQVPVVSSKTDSLEEVTLGLLNYYEPPTDEVKLADAIRKVIENPPSKEQLQDISKKYEMHYSIDVFGKRICEFLEKMNV